jgi:broad specificity phosphatase PhoE
MSDGGDAAVYLVRHAKAGDREQWTEDDRLRPLTKKGRRQAEGLVQLFSRVEVRRIVSSPYLRCGQTVRPLALDRGITIEFDEALAEAAALDAAMRLVTSSPAGTVLCSHGDIIPAVVGRLVEQGASIPGEPGWKKGSTWILDRRGDRIGSARYVPPPTYR